MVNPKYSINISYVDPVVNGVTGATANGVWTTSPAYSEGKFRAFMPQLNISATGSSYTEALANLLVTATGTPELGMPPIK